MPDGKRLWRTSKGDLVGDGHAEAVVLAYGSDDALSADDLARVRKAAEKPADKQSPKARDKRAAPARNK